MKRIIISLVMSVVLLGSASGCGRPGDAGSRFNVASYNLRQLNEGDDRAGNGWTRRLPVVAALIAFHDFDIFGTQEGFKSQLEQLKGSLKGYDYIGVGREDGKEQGEHSAIFYRTDLFDVLDHGDFWLSETPDKPSMGWDAACVRICTWGKFRHRPSGKEFMMFNLHMDHVGSKARVESARLVQEKIAEIGGGMQAIVTGDFNVDQTHASYAALTSGGRLRDSFVCAGQVYALNGTFNNYSTADYTTSRIDHIFVTPEINVEKYGVLTDTYRTSEDAVASAPHDAPAEIEMQRYVSRTPSDHFPVRATVTL